MTPICVGTSPLASMARLYGYDVDEERAIATVEAVFAGPLDFLDTSNGYGEHGEAEVRIGAAVRRAGGLPAGIVLATKVDPAPGSDDFSGDRVRASFAESLERLGVDRVPLLHLHDPERIAFEDAVATGGPVEALVALREQGLVDRIGVAGGPVPLLQRYLDTGAFRYGVPLAAAALQFSTRATDVHSTVVGVSSPERIAQTVELASIAIPDELWAELETLVPPADGWLDPPA